MSFSDTSGITVKFQGVDMLKSFGLLILLFGVFMGYAYTQTSKTQAPTQTQNESPKVRVRERANQEEIKYFVEFFTGQSVELHAIKGNTTQKVRCIPHPQYDEWIIEDRTPSTNWFSGFPHQKYARTKRHDRHEPVMQCLEKTTGKKYND